MRTAEEVAREVQQIVGPGSRVSHHRDLIAGLIRARDAEVRGEALAEVEQLTQSLEAAYYALTGGLSARSDSDAWKKSQFARDILRDALDRP